MSCIRFNTPAQKQQLADNAPAMREDGGDPVAQFLSPSVTDSKRERIRRLAASPNPRIRESAALSYHAPDDVHEALANDPDAGVRSCLARNERTPCDVLRTLASDRDEQVRAWVAINYFVPADAMEKLAADESETVRALVAWKASLAETAQPALV
ncbi:hypothetical protein EV141_2354 [Microcella putealis]|uniref:Leucine rich repeat (LRR) protein n=1 Tax=Microcella putealis TaxID=337005 RepID=A0A4Q7LKM4_9MICO|nr:hypothetical protein [Microcella putealis]RZS54357.1 hypothetical protein EV141_2354 [Microcella putealis]TQM24889.1 hypothetical protein BJ957_1152 [Microcella putealis]